MLENEVKGNSKVQQWCENKYEHVESDLLEFFNTYKNAKDMNVYPIISKILTSKDKISKLKQREFDDPYDLEFCFDKFKDIMATINLHVIYVPSQQSFCMFMGWTDRIYKKMLKETPNDISDIMQLVDEYLLECQISAGQQGILKQNLTKYRSQLAGEHGQNLVTQKEQMEDDRSKRKQKTQKELFKALEDMGFKQNEISVNKKR